MQLLKGLYPDMGVIGSFTMTLHEFSQGLLYGLLRKGFTPQY